MVRHAGKTFVLLVCIAVQPCFSRPLFAQTSNDESKLTIADWTNVREIELTETKTWGFRPSSEAMSKFTPKRSELPVANGKSELLETMVISQQAGKAALLYKLSKGVWVVVVQLDSGDVVVSQKSSRAFRLFDFDADGTRLLMGRNTDTERSVLESWVIDAGNAKSVASFQLFPNDTLNNIIDARFLDKNRLVATTEAGHVVVVDLKSSKALFHIQLSEKCIPCVSDDKRHLAFCSNEHLWAVNLDSGAVVGQLALPGMRGNIRCEFSSSGKQLAAGLQGAFSRDSRVIVVDMSKGSVVMDARPSIPSAPSQMLFPADGYLLLANSHLIETASETNVWNYKGATSLARGLDHVYYVIGKTLVPVKLPHEEALRMLTAAKSADDIEVWKRGRPVKLNLDGVPEPHRERVQDLLLKSLQSAGVALADDATTSVYAEIQGPAEEKLSLPLIGTHDVTRYNSVVSIRFGSQVLWQNTISNIPDRLSGAGKRTYAEYLKELSSAPNFDLFRTPDFPYRLQRSIDGSQASAQRTGVLPLQFLGQSQLTINGATQK